MPRRRFVRLAVAAAMVPGMPRQARARAYPARAVRWIVGFSPGGGTDSVSRVMAQWLSDRLGQPVVVENRPGASTNLSIQAALNSPPDGYTVVVVTASSAINVTLSDRPSLDLLRSVVPVAGLIDFPVVLVTNPAVPARTVAQFIDWARDNPGVGIASYGTGSTSHMALELFKSMTGLNLVHVPYRGDALAVADTISGQVQGTFATLTAALPHIVSGAVRLVAVAGKNRSEFMPDAPTVAETVPGYEAYSWVGLGVAAGTPAEIIARLNSDINAGLVDPAVRHRLATLAATPIVHTPESFGTLVRSEVDKWAGVIKTAGIKRD